MGLFGMDSYMVQVEADLSQGLPRFDIVGLPDAAISEAKNRVRSAIKNTGFAFPVSRITVNLAPADTRKEGSVYDLPILMALLKAGRQINFDSDNMAFIGEVALDGLVRRVDGALPEGVSLMTQRPFRSPHHTVSPAGLSGGGTIPRPGEISLAHNGVLFLDELPEFSRQAMEVLRQPMEDSKITISRVSASLSYPCSAMIVCAMNPCPCGYYGHPTRRCTCTQQSVQRYLSRLSGPLLDRLDIHIEVPPVEFASLSGTSQEECSADIRKRVNAARAIQTERLKGSGISCNAKMDAAQTKKFCRPTPEGMILLERVFEKLELSARAYDKILRIARTVADLDGSETVNSDHISQAVQYRSLDRTLWRNVK